MPRHPLARSATFAAVPSVLFAALLESPLAAQNLGLQFTTGVDAAVEVPFDTALVPATGLTVEAWITYDDSTIPTGLYHWPTIARQNITANGESWLLRVGASNTNNRNVEFSVRNPQGLQVLTYTFAPGEFSSFTHLAGTYDGRNMAIYKNGALVSSRVLSQAFEVLNNGGILRVGNGDAVSPGREAWNGMIDELRVWPVPRSAAEITATMNQELSQLPGGVLTFNWNGNYLDTSRGLQGAAFGPVMLGTGPALVPIPSTMFPLAPGTSNCARVPQIVLGSTPSVGNSAFTVWCSHGPRPANSPLGVVVAATRSAPVAQPPLLGVNLAFDLNAILGQVLFIPGTTALGLQSLALPIPANPGVSGIALVMQYGFADAACGPQGFTASSAIAFGVQ